MKTVLVNPLDETLRSRGRAARRLDTLAAKTIGLLDISKPGGRFFLDRLEVLLQERAPGAQVVRASKPTFTRPAPDDVIRSLVESGCHAVVEALAD
jgi:hypothetical protein